MAFVTGTATNAADLFSKLLEFLTENQELIDANQNWTKAWISPAGEQAGVIVRGPGLATQQSIPVGLKLHQDSVRDQYWIEEYGMSGVIASSTEMLTHINNSPAYVRMFLDSQPMTYWFIANGRRFVVIVKISTIFETLYGGLFLPYATPLSYPYPYLIGGTAGEVYNDLTQNSWRTVLDNHRQFPFSTVVLGGANPATPGAWMLSPAAEWKSISGVTDITTQVSPDVIVHPNRTAPLNAYFDDSATRYTDNEGATFGVREANELMTAAKDGTLTMTQMHLVAITPNDEAVFGVFDGCYRVVGFSNSSENLVTIEGVDHLTVQNVYRTGTNDYWAARLE